MIMCPLISDRTTWSDGLVKPHKSLGVMDNVPTLLATNPTKVLSSPSNPENPNTNGPGPKLFRGSNQPKDPHHELYSKPKSSRPDNLGEHETTVEEPGVPCPRPQNLPTATKKTTKRTKKNKGCGISELSQKIGCSVYPNVTRKKID